MLGPVIQCPRTVMSPNSARPITLRTSPSDYSTFNQIQSFKVDFGKKKRFSPNAFIAEQGWISAKIGK